MTKILVKGEYLRPFLVNMRVITYPKFWQMEVYDGKSNSYYGEGTVFQFE